MSVDRVVSLEGVSAEGLSTASGIAEAAGGSVASGSVARAEARVEPLDPKLQIRLPSFEGPLDLLLHLIRKHELDIHDLPIVFVTQTYLDYLARLTELNAAESNAAESNAIGLNLDVASEYLVMAATLVYIKSRSLLPKEAQPAEEAEDEEEMDPRDALVRRLLEYQRYKEAARALMEDQEVRDRDVFGRHVRPLENGERAPLARTTVISLIDAFERVLQRTKMESAFSITAERVSVAQRIGEIFDALDTRRSCAFEDLFEAQASRADLVVTFLSILEMVKLKVLSVYQDAARASIQIRLLTSRQDAALDSFVEDA